MMDREWMRESRLSQKYADGVEEFINFALDHGVDPMRIVCPCVNCSYVKRISMEEIRDHLVVNGINQDYTRWIWHGEKAPSPMPSCDTHEFEARDTFEGDRIDDLLHDVEDDFGDGDDAYANLMDDAQKPLYTNCINFTRLSATLKLYNLKASNGWTDKSFNALLELLKEMLPEPNCLPNRTYEAKKIMRSLGMDYERIHACPNDCILYRNEYESLQNCPNPLCGAPRYKKKEVPSKVLWYFPIIPRFRRLFKNVEDAKELVWHSKERIDDGKLRHPADSPQWKTIDALYPDFGHGDRNLRLALSTDGMCPFGTLSSVHITWSVFLIIYNLPPWLCKKRKYMMLSLLISGPKAPGNDIDVYLTPLIDDLKLLWEDGIEAYDANRKESFCLRAMLFCTINDFPAYGNLAGCTVKGYKACPICGKSTCSVSLKKSNKIVYMKHRKFLSSEHRYRRLCKAFDGSVEDGKAPMPLTGHQVFDLVKDLKQSNGKKCPPEVSEDGFKKRSIFFELPYWKDLPVRHCLDVMHIEKNICDSLIGTLLNMPGKTKDGLKAREDYDHMKIRTELAPKKTATRTYLPPACYNLSKNEKDDFCRFLQGIKVPEGYSSNISSLVSLKDSKLVGLKSHDCHILLQQFLPVAIRAILPKHVRYAITRLCLFFRKLCSKVVDPKELSNLQKEIVETVCQLEMYFPPAFFDIMVHLPVHLVREVQLCGPVNVRWMYPIERCMKILKGYVKNPNRPEGCIVESYSMEEVVNFCDYYLPGVDFIGLPKKSHLREEEWRGTSGAETLNISDSLWRTAHLYILHNTDSVQPYVTLHMDYVRSCHPRHARNEQWLANEHNRTFIDWFKTLILEQVNSGEAVSDDLKWLSQGPKYQVMSYTGMEVDNCTFYTKDHDDKSAHQNSGVTLVAQAMHVSSAKDKNPVLATMSYYGVIESIWVLIYTDKIQIPVFYCKWAENNNGVEVDDLGFIRVDLNRMGHTNDPFILATQAKQIFYVTDPIDSRWSIVISAPNRSFFDDIEDICDEGSNSNLVTPQAEHENEDIVYIRDDHNEGIWLDEETLGGKSGQSQSSKKRKHKQN